MTKYLTIDERQNLLSAHKKERDKRIADRIKVVLLLDDGYSYEEISKILFVDDSTVRRHQSDYEQTRELKLNHKGSEPILTKKEESCLSEHLENNLYTKVKEIVAYVESRFKKKLSVSGMYRWLKRNKFTYKKPKLTPYDPKIEDQLAFIESYKKTLNDAAIEGDIVLFGDVVHPTQQTRPSYGWVKKGKEKLLEVKSGRKRSNIMGAIQLEDMDLTYQDFETINAQSTISFFKKLEDKYIKKRKIHLILDRAGYFTAREVAEYLKTSRIKVHYLPPRSPNLNAIERFWKVMHEHVSNNRVYNNFKDFKDELFNFLDNTVKKIIPQLISSVSDNFKVRKII